MGVRTAIRTLGCPNAVDRSAHRYGGNGAGAPRGRSCKCSNTRPPLVFGFLLVLALILLSALPSRVRAQAVRLHVSADSVSVGERFTVSVVATHRFSNSAFFPPANGGPEVFGDLDVIRRTDAQRRFLGSDQPGTRVDSVAYEVTTFAIDSARVPAMPVRFTAQGDTVTVSTSPRTIPVRSMVPPDAAGLRDLAPLATFPGPWWPWVLLTLATLVALGGLVYYWRLRQQSDAEPEPEERPTPSVPPYEVARRRLKKLRRTTDLESLEAPKPFYIELSDILRSYLARRLRISALERTTGELTQSLRQHPQVPAEAVESVESALEQADLVKFAEARPSPAEHQAALDATVSALDAIEAAQPPTDGQKSAPAPSTVSE